MDNDRQPIISTTHGQVKGQKRTTVYDEPYYSFEKIPFAKPPVGELRFRAPVPANPWNGILDCTAVGERPLQKNSYTKSIEGSEDCLFLNFYVKNLRDPKHLPVMVYLYGGGFQTGGATRDALSPDYFMHENVIIVTLNFRLGPLGFLSAKDPSLKIPGNAGLKDQVLALRWIKNNCLNFNGDPNNITIFGHSAGGASVHHLMLAKQTEGLFHKAIIMAGTVNNYWALLPPGNYAYRLAKTVGYQGEDNDRQVFEFLMQANASSLIGHEIMTEEERLNGPQYVFGPSIETYVDEDCLIPTNPRSNQCDTWSNNIPVMIGGTSSEGLLNYQRVKASPKDLEAYNEHPEYFVPIEKRKRMSSEESRELGLKVKSMYLGTDRVSLENIFTFIRILSHKTLWYGFYRTILLRLKFAKAPTYVYHFDFDSPTFNLYRLKFCGPGFRGVSHADELSYLFYGKHSWKLEKESDEYKTIERMVGMWTAFAKNSNPNCERIQPVLWEPTREDEPKKCLNISQELGMIELPQTDMLDFWNEVYFSDGICG